MNEDTIKANWKKLKAAVKKQWSKLTDDDIKKAESNFESLYGDIQHYYGDSKEKTKAKIKDMLDKIEKETPDDTDQDEQGRNDDDKENE